MRQVKMRYMTPGLAPRRTKLEIPGWAGDRSPRADGAHEQVWHCTPFSEGAQYGIEIFYPFDFELRAATREGRLHIEGDFRRRPSPVCNGRLRNFGGVFSPIRRCSTSIPARATRSAPSRIRASIRDRPGPARSPCRR